MSSVRDWGEFQDWAQQVLGAITAVGSSQAWPDLLGNVALNLGVCPRAVPMTNLQEPAVYMDFFASALDVALFPHLRRHPLAAAA